MGNTKLNFAAVLGIALLAAIPTYADDSPQAVKLRIGSGNPVAGKDKSAVCQGCHGQDGQSVIPSFPKLAGQYADYIQRQIFNFQEGTRRDPSMTEIAATVTNRQNLADIAAYFASQNQMSGKPTKHEQGEKLYRETGCINCHGEVGKGKPFYNALFPIIGGQYKDYLIKQMNDFKTGERDTDMSGMMYSLAIQMTDTEIEAVSEYLSGQ